MKMKTNIVLVKIAILFIAMSFTAFAEKDSTYKVVVDRITVNGREITEKERKDIVIGRSDSIRFHYHCEANGANKVPILFKLRLKNKERESNPPATRARTAFYTDLPQTNYKLQIKAFSPKKQWNTKPAIVKFRVNDEEAKLRKKIRTLEKKLKNQESEEKITSLWDNFDLFSLIIGLAIGTVFAFIAVNGTKNKKQRGKSKTSLAEEDFKGEYDITDLELETIMKDNAKLKAEAEALRNQISNLQQRSEELKKQNKDLQENISKLSKSKDELEDLQEQKNELLALIVHDIKNPVSLMKSLVELLKSYDLTATEQQEIIEDISNTTSKIVTLSQEVSKILSLESSRLQLNYTEADLNDILADVARRYEPAADNKSITLYFKRNDSLPECEMDVIKIDDVLDNLVSNAVKFTPEEGKVYLGAKLQEDCVVVDVSDNGQGLSEEDIKQAFKRGSKLSARPTGGEHSSGLGLWIVKKLVELHGGKVWIKSAVGKGSTFSFRIPIRKPDEDEIPEPSEE